MRKMKVFLSYCSEDKNKMRSLQRLLRSTSGLTDIVVADKRSALEDLSQKVCAEIDKADFFVPILTRRSIPSQWVNQEIGYARARVPNWAIKPIVEEEISRELEGFIHRNVDLPYTFPGDPNARKEALAFLKYCKLLVQDLQLGIDDPAGTPDELFRGRWKNTYTNRSGEVAEEEFEIRGTDQYYVKNRHVFNVIDFHHDSRSGRIKFRKVGVGRDQRDLMNDLVQVDARTLEGTEMSLHKVRYQRIG